MTDFFTRLAERTLGLVPVAQPIIAPMFALNTLNDEPQVLMWSNQSQGAMGKTEDALAQGNQPVFSKSVSMVRAKLPHMMTEHNYEDNSILKPTSNTVNPKDLLIGKRSKEKVPDHDEPSTDVVISEQNLRHSQESEHSLNAQKGISGHRIGLDNLSTTQRDIPAASEAQHIEISTVRWDEPRRFHSQNVTTHDSSSSTPTIQVTIGRIEVRAITPPVAPPQRPRKPSPALSLDDYLKQRNGGQR